MKYILVEFPNDVDIEVLDDVAHAIRKNLEELILDDCTTVRFGSLFTSQ